MGARGLTSAAALVGALALGGCGEGQGDPGTPTAETRAVVRRVNDGDTLRTADGARVRLVQIDAPELDADCYGVAARRELTRLVPPGTRVVLVRDPALDDRDAYGRLLRYVLVDGENVNVELVRRGAASPYFFRQQRGRFAGELLRAVEAARAAPVGYWRACPRAELDPSVGSVTGRR